MTPSSRLLIRALTIGIFAVTIAWDLIQQSLGDGPFSWTGLLIAGGMAVVLLPLIWRVTGASARADRIFADAKVGLGTLVQARRTGTSINDDPEIELVLDVETPEGTVFRSSTRAYLELSEHATLVPGTPFPVDYLPDNRIRLRRVADDKEFEDAMYAIRVAQGRMTPHQVRVAKEGVHARAVVMSAEPTGEIVDGEAVIRLHVRVTRPDGTVFDNTRELPLPSISLPGLQPGTVVDARYLAGDERDVSVSIRVR